MLRRALATGPIYPCANRAERRLSALINLPSRARAYLRCLLPSRYSRVNPQVRIPGSTDSHLASKAICQRAETVLPILAVFWFDFRRSCRDTHRLPAILDGSRSTFPHKVRAHGHQWIVQFALVLRRAHRATRLRGPAPLERVATKPLSWPNLIGSAGMAAIPLSETEIGALACSRVGAVVSVLRTIFDPRMVRRPD
jgi:hypothetical protein